jgi:hypothetical protein
MADFWICEGRSEWNSFDRQIASRGGLPHHAIAVHCRPFRDLLKEYGTPFYLKVDIEGHDHYCLDGLDSADLPQYLSLEMGPLESLFRLRDIGYTGFKLITQNDHSQLAIDLFGFRELAKRRLRPHPGLFALGRRLAGAGGGSPLELNYRPWTRDGWEFQFGSSGPFGEDTDGPWHRLEDVAYTWVTYRLGQSKYGSPGLEVWHDVHATRAKVA